MISVVIPLYNKERQIAQTLQSVLNQSFQDFEIVVVDDGSTDSSAEAVRSVHDPRLRLIEQSNSGVSAARNRGIAEAKYDLVAFLDADDLWKPTYLQTQYELVHKYPQCDVFACNYEFQDAQGNVKPTIIRKLPFEGEDGILSNYFEVASCSHPPICSISIMVRKHVIQQIGGFPVGIRSGEDLLTWARLASKYTIAYSKKVGACFQVEGYSISDKPKRLPDPENRVGLALRQLSKQSPLPGLNHYIALWDKMRASIYMRLGMRKECFKEILNSLRFNPLQLKLFCLAILVCLPDTIRTRILTRL